MACTKNDVPVEKAVFTLDLIRFRIGSAPIFLIFKKK